MTYASAISSRPSGRMRTVGIGAAYLWLADALACPTTFPKGALLLAAMVALRCI